MKKSQLIVMISLLGIIGFSGLCFAQSGLVDTMTGNLEGSILSGGEDSESQLVNAIGLIIASFLSLIGIVFFVLMIYGGYTWMLAKGAEDEVTKAKNIIRAAIAGLIVVMAAYAISYFITTQLEKAAGVGQGASSEADLPELPD